MVLRCLVVIAHEEVGRESAAGYDAAYCLHALQVLLACVLAVHQLQYLCRTALRREVDVLAEVRLFGYGVQDVVGHVLGVGCGEAYAHIGHALRHLVQQFGERAAALDALSGRRESVAVHVLSEQCHLLEATVVQVAHLAQDALHVARAFASASIGHNAVVAEVVAAAHDAHETAHAVATDALRHNVAVGLSGAQFDVHGVLSVLALRNHVRQIEVGVGTANEVGEVVLYEVFAHTLSHAAEHAEYQLASLLLLCVQSLKSSVYLVLCVLADRASIEEDGISLSLVLAQFVACHLHNGSHYFRVCHIHLAAVCLDKKFLHLYNYVCFKWI